MYQLKYIAVSLVLLLSACVTTEAPPTLTPLQIQSLQTREYEEGKEIVFPSVLSVFQDLGYIVKTADKDTGFITAESPTDGGYNIWIGATTATQTAATAFIEQIGEVTKVRLNIVNKRSSSSAYGQNTQSDTAILDVAIYQNAFEKIESAIFIRSSN